MSMDASTVQNRNIRQPQSAGTSVPVIVKDTTQPVSTGSQEIVGDASQYGPIPIPRAGDTIAQYQHPSLLQNKNQYDFLELSYRGGPAYKDGRDGQGKDIIWRHEDLRESPEGFERRKRMAVYINHCKPIVNKFVDFVFRQEIVRDAADQQYAEWSKDVDMRSKNLNPFIRTAMKRACVLGHYYIQIDSTRARDGRELTVAQARDLGVRMFLQYVDPRRVINWRRESCALTEALILYGNGSRAILWRTAEMYDIEIDAGGEIKRVTPGRHDWTVNGTPRLPIIQVSPLEGESLIGDIAELARDHFNVGALLREDLYNATFTQRWLVGVKPEEFEETIQGSNRVICLPRPEAKIHTTGADPGVSDTLMKMADMDVREIYRQAGLKAEDPIEVGQAKSGIALKVEFNDLAALLGAIAEEAERVESEIVEFYNAFYNAGVTPPEYPDEFGEPDVQVELDRSLTVLESASMTPTAKLLESRRINRILHPQAAPSQMADMNEESTQMFGPQVEPPTPPKTAEEKAAEQMEALLARREQEGRDEDGEPQEVSQNDTPPGGGD